MNGTRRRTRFVPSARSNATSPGTEGKLGPSTPGTSVVTDITDSLELEVAGRRGGVGGSSKVTSSSWTEENGSGPKVPPDSTTPPVTTADTHPRSA